MTCFFYTALDALWMLRNYGMSFEKSYRDYKGEIIECKSPEWEIQQYAPHETGAERFYPDASGLALLRPREGDWWKRNGRMVLVISQERYLDMQMNMRANEEDRLNFVIGLETLKISIREYPEIEHKCSERDGKPFIMPQREDAQSS